jgi:hypothetical protein
MRRILFLSLLAFSLLALSSSKGARAETITLIDGTKMTGEVLHAYKGEFTVKTPQGEVVLDKGKIRSISFEAPVARATYSTPEKTLDAWRDATAKGDPSGMVEAYALVYQGMVGQEMEQMDFKAKSQMIADVSHTKFTVKTKKQEKEKATLTVDQEKDGETRSGDIRFVLENGEWKMTP